ncbi:MAG: 30S ribosomal protein S6 [Candidatus Niyogibacteria bacterium]|nr:MAG: 30S ribosomal protein S6 [Candidatus Niyogibacteria bacterium]
MDTESDPKLYEISYLAKAADEQAALDGAASITGIIEKERGIIATQNRPTKKDLSYPIEGAREGWWGWIKFMSRPESIGAIREKANNDPKIERFAIFKINKAEIAEKSRTKRRIIRPPEEKTNIEEIDKKLEEILGN